ncbi:hypothetical protein [Achromobacter spanius]|uniref:Transposase DDE domain-containing protein n=1 Tax=Achromobacter spanius TaxID=217203 RepID=A0AA42S6A8_9BURK|nr:hypothetical protein [Achromobacter spanius]MDH0738984.1 hypothetical protein [Achromobacter spanius]
MNVDSTHIKMADAPFLTARPQQQYAGVRRQDRLRIRIKRLEMMKIHIFLWAL